jgi:DNA-binding NarL/FixJ family response regulator
VREFFTADRDCTTSYCSAGLIDNPMLARGLQILRDVLSRGETLELPIVERIDANLLVRIVRIFGEGPDRFAVFFEAEQTHSAIEAAAKRHGLTKREIDVLELLICGQSTREIAQRLRITSSTVIHYVNSLFHKTKTHKRAELVSYVYQDGPESPREMRA